MAIKVPITHMIRDRPTLPDKDRIVLGVAKIPVPITRLKIKKEALMTPIWRRSSGVASKTLPSSGVHRLVRGITWQTTPCPTITRTQSRHAIRSARALFDSLGVGKDALLIARVNSCVRHFGVGKNAIHGFKPTVRTWRLKESYIALGDARSSETERLPPEAKP